MIGGIDPFVVLICEGQKIETSYKPNTTLPIWNECFTFDIKRGDDPLRLVVYDRGTFSNTFIGKLMINLDTIGTQQEVTGWYSLHEENYDSDRYTGKIKVKVQWIYSRAKLLEAKVQELQEHQKKIDEIKRAHEREMIMLKSPFGSLFRDPNMLMEEGDPDILLSIYQAHPKELEASKTVDRIVRPLKEKSKLYDAFWSFMFGIAYLIYFLITMILCFFKPEFLNLVAVCLAFYLLPNVNLREDMNSVRDKKKTIRVCVFIIFVSIVYDVIWLIMLWDSWWGVNKYDGDVEMGFRRFTLIGTIVSIVLRFFIFLVFWRMSLDYFRFINANMLSGMGQPSEKLVFLRN